MAPSVMCAPKFVSLLPPPLPSPYLSSSSSDGGLLSSPVARGMDGRGSNPVAGGNAGDGGRRGDTDGGGGRRGGTDGGAATNTAAADELGKSRH